MVLIIIACRFDDSKPRSLIEAYIIEHLAPLVVGTQEEARKNGFIGMLLLHMVFFCNF